MCELGPALQLARQDAHKPRHVLPIHAESNYTPDRHSALLLKWLLQTKTCSSFEVR